MITLLGGTVGFDAISKDRSLRQLLQAEVFPYTLIQLSKRVVIVLRSKSFSADRRSLAQWLVCEFNAARRICL
ncbi:hypothetical protein, partial [Pseudomonas sp. FSL R10-0071]|uniref:hypothetical protein n=1 Tax=Pseudomonas sp. FSL R10-0071 TaxID=2662193 RepID=UPI001C49AD85